MTDLAVCRLESHHSHHEPIPILYSERPKTQSCDPAFVVRARQILLRTSLRPLGLNRSQANMSSGSHTSHPVDRREIVALTYLHPQSQNQGAGRVGSSMILVDPYRY